MNKKIFEKKNGFLNWGKKHNLGAKLVNEDPVMSSFEEEKFDP